MPHYSKNTTRLRRIPALLLLFLLLFPGTLESFGIEASNTPTKWNDCLKQPPQWYSTDEAVRIADNLILFQRGSGGWPKNVEMAAVLNASSKAKLEREKRLTDSTIDNGATYNQLRYLAKVYSATSLERHLSSFNRGIDFLLAAQYPNGGWPQYYPRLEDYYKRITFNDGAMIGVLELLKDVAEAVPPYQFTDSKRRAAANDALRRGIECILKTQVLVNGVRTVWCAQHDEVTLLATSARTFEPAALSGGESAGIVRFLMNIRTPGKEIVESIESAISWFKRTRISGIRWELVSTKKGEQHRRVTRDPEAAPLWARFYEIQTNRPIFVGRDGVIKYDVSQIEEERRDNYMWYVNDAATLLERDYPAWAKRERGNG